MKSKPKKCCECQKWKTENIRAFMRLLNGSFLHCCHACWIEFDYEPFLRWNAQKA